MGVKIGILQYSDEKYEHRRENLKVELFFFTQFSKQRKRITKHH